MKKKTIEKIDRFFEAGRLISIMFITFTTIVVYNEFLLPKLTWSTWIITPAFIYAMIGFVWVYGGVREAFIIKKEDKNDKERS